MRISHFVVGSRDSRQRHRSRVYRAAAVGLAALAFLCCSSERADRPTADAGRIAGRTSDGLVFVRIEDGSADLARARLADGAVELIKPTPDREETWPYWSDAARRVVFQVGTKLDLDDAGSAAALSKSDLVLWDLELGTETRLPGPPERSERWPAWSPDGRFVVFAFLGGRPAAGIARFELLSGAVDLLATTSREAILLRPSFERSGRRISLEQQGEDGRGSQLRLLDASPGSELRAVTRDVRSIDTKAFFGRSGEELLFTREPLMGRVQHHRRRIYHLAAAGGAARPVFESEPEVSEPKLHQARELDEHSARPSPSREEFAFVSNRDSRGSVNDSELYIAALDGNDVRRLTETPNWSEHAPRWSPDGELIAVTAVPSELLRPRLADNSDLAQIRLRVFNREGELLFDEPGMMADWMPPWP